MDGGDEAVPIASSLRLSNILKWDKRSRTLIATHYVGLEGILLSGQT
jgi:hypothetical protein